jgi:photosystem II stability/assembly factor-like uncharacterized protein
VAGALSAAPGAVTTDWRPIAPQSGYVPSVVADPQSGQVFAVTNESGVYRSDDRGVTWRTSNQGLPPERVTLLRAAPGAVYAIVNARLYRTTEGGTSWVATGLAESLFGLALAPSAPETLYALVQGPRILRSDDGGVDWEETGGFLEQQFDQLAVDPGDPNRLYASTSGGPFWTSLDGGAHWTQVGTLPPDQYHHDLITSPSVPATLYIVAGGKLQRSRDHGAHWSRIDSTFPSDGGVLSVAALAFPTPRLYATVGRFPVGRPTLGLLYVSPDEGATWRLLKRSSALHSVAVDPARPRRIYLGTEQQGVLWSGDAGARWTQGNGLRDIAGLDVAVDPVTPGRLYLSTTLGLSTTADGGATWRSLPLAPPFYPYRVTPDPQTAGTLYVLPRSSGPPIASLYRSHDFGATLEPVNLPAGLNLEEVAIDPEDPRHQLAVGAAPHVVCNSFDCISCPHYQAFSSTDGGATWASFVDTLVGAEDFGIFTGVRIDPLDSRNIGLIGGQSFLSLDRGSSWVSLQFSSGPLVKDLVFDPFQEKVLYAAAPTLWKSLDGGLTWARLTGLPLGVLRLAADRKTPGTLYAAVAGLGVWVTTDSGVHWAPLGAGLPNLPVRALVADPSRAGHLFATTLGYGGLYVHDANP